ncbi:HEPN domain-containing protein [Arthrobacter koreensis]|uniref:HEPN domain-containing protein n=1 Tax=Arthrobacter koreensis TaxID=199136 RepID=UPI0036DF7569
MTTEKGEFWVPGGRRVPGELEILDNGSYCLRTQGYCVPPKQIEEITGGIALRDTPEHIVADFEPQTVYGETSSGPLTLWAAHMTIDFEASLRPGQKFTGENRVIGAHIASMLSPISGIRWVWNARIGRAGEIPDEVASLEGSLRSWELNGLLGLEFLPRNPVAVRTLMEIQESCSQLIGLWTGRWEVPQATVTQLLLGDTWCDFETPEHLENMRVRSNLLALSDLSVQKMGAWMAQVNELYPIAHMINASIPTIEVDAQVRTTALEGLHRRLYDADRGQRPFQGLSQAAVDRARRAAREAGVEVLAKEGTDRAMARTRFQFALANVNELTYEERVRRLVEDIQEIASGMWGPDLQVWLSQTKKVRNVQSHLLPESRQAVDISKYFMITVTTRWTLTLRVLLDVVGSAKLKHALSNSQTFEFALANVDAEHPWSDEEYSALRTFRNATSQQKGDTGHPPDVAG